MTKKQEEKEALKVEVNREINFSEGILRELLLKRDIKNYLKENLKLKRLEEKRLDLESDIQELKYSTCKHIWVNCKCGKETVCRCVKCGLDYNVKKKNFSDLTYEEHIMSRVLLGNSIGRFITLDADYNFLLEIVKNILIKYPDLTDDELIVYLKEITHDNLYRGFTLKYLAKKV